MRIFLIFKFKFQKIYNFIFKNSRTFHNYYKSYEYRISWYTTKHIDKDSYPIKPTSTASEIQVVLPQEYRCFKSKTTYFKYHEYSIPQLKNEGFAIKFNDPYEILTKNAPTFFTMDLQTLTFEIAPKISRIDEALVEEDLEV